MSIGRRRITAARNQRQQQKPFHAATITRAPTPRSTAQKNKGDPGWDRPRFASIRRSVNRPDDLRGSIYVEPLADALAEALALTETLIEAEAAT
jgi:hypothetical protein